MRKVTYNVFIFLYVCVCVHSHAAQISFSTGSAKTIEQALTERGVGTDHDSLMSALKGRDQVTQALAASELASQHAHDAVPDVHAAFNKANQSVPRFNLAQALYAIEPADGSKLMTELCQSSRENGVVRLYASRVIQNTGSHDCDKAILEIPLSSDDPSVKLMALALLVPGASNAVNTSEVFTLEAKLLNDENNAVRTSAASALVAGKNPGAQEMIQKRLAIETNSEVRESLFGLLASPSTRSPRR